MATPKTVPLGKKLGEGAGGAVYQHPLDRSLAIKVLNNPSSHDIARIKAALGIGIPCDVPNSRARLAWPTELYRDAQGNIRGFVMPIAAGISPVIVASIMHRRERRTLAGNLGFNLLLHYATACCAIVGHYHDYRIVVGDLNERNLMASGDGWVSGIDTDSVQFTDAQGNQFLNGFYTPEFLAPELVGVNLAQTPRRDCHDDFALAVIVFMLLCDGWHPFVGVSRNKQSVNEAANASNGHFAYPGNCPALAPPKGAPPWEVIPRSLAGPLEQTFTAATDGSKRTRAWDLHAAAVSALGGLVLCNGAEQHYYPREQPACPWCSYYGTIPGPRPHARSPRVRTNSRAGVPTAGRAPQAWPAAPPQPVGAPKTPSPTTTAKGRPPSPTRSPRVRPAWFVGALAAAVVVAATAASSSGPSSGSGSISTNTPTPQSAPVTPTTTTTSGVTSVEGTPREHAPAPPIHPGPTAVITAHFHHIARGEIRAAFMLFSPSWRAGHRGWVAQREDAKPQLDLQAAGPSHINRSAAYVYVSFVAHDTVPVPGSDTECRRFRGWARLISVKGDWRYEPGGKGLNATILPSSLRECQ